MQTHPAGGDLVLDVCTPRVGGPKEGSQREWASWAEPGGAHWSWPHPQLYLRELLRLTHLRFYQHLVSLGEDGLQMLFCHRWLLLCFKREFPEAEALRIWEACWAHYQVSRGEAPGTGHQRRPARRAGVCMTVHLPPPLQPQPPHQATAF